MDPAYKSMPSFLRGLLLAPVDDLSQKFFTSADGGHIEYENILGSTWSSTTSIVSQPRLKAATKLRVSMPVLVHHPAQLVVNTPEDLISQNLWFVSMF